MLLLSPNRRYFRNLTDVLLKISFDLISHFRFCFFLYSLSIIIMHSLQHVYSILFFIDMFVLLRVSKFKVLCLIISVATEIASLRGIKVFLQ